MMTLACATEHLPRKQLVRVARPWCSRLSGALGALRTLSLAPSLPWPWGGQALSMLKQKRVVLLDVRRPDEVSPGAGVRKRARAQACFQEWSWHNSRRSCEHVCSGFLVLY